MARRGSNPLGWTESVPLDVKYRGYGGAGEPGRADVAARSSLTRVIDPPYREKLPSSQDFNVQDYNMNLLAGIGQQITSDALRFQIPQGTVGWLQEVTFYTLTPTALTSVSFAIRINQGPVAGFSDIQNTPGVANFARDDKGDLRIRIPDGAVVDIIITNRNANGPWTLGGKLAGWFHPFSDEVRIYGEI